MALGKYFTAINNINMFMHDKRMDAWWKNIYKGNILKSQIILEEKIKFNYKFRMAKSRIGTKNW